MQFITGLFGGSENTLLTAVFALGAVLVLIVLAVWLLKLISNVSGGVARGRNRRLSMVDSLALDQKRQLLIIRRDDVEHLILVGGPQDIVVETGIPVAEAASTAPTPRRTLPLVARKQPETEPVAPAPVVRPEPAPEVTAAPGTLLEQLQKSGHTGARKTRVSLRQTGLMRPASNDEPTSSGQNPDNSGDQRPDSAKQDRHSVAGEGMTLEHDDSNDAKRT